MLSHLCSFLLDFLFPKSCAGCGRWENYLCDGCKTTVQFFEFSVCPTCDRPTANGRTHEVCKTPLSLDGLIAIAQYDEPISTLVKKVKYRYVSNAIGEMGDILMQHWPSYAPQFDLLIPIPMHAKKQGQRGFNQAELLARYICSSLTIPMRSDLLKKIEHTASQASLRLKDRKRVLSLGFVCTSPVEIRGKTIGLVDDVTTTRTTLKLAGKVLKQNGAKEVWGVVFAHRF